jgi:hypothetical protein
MVINEIFLRNKLIFIFHYFNPKWLKLKLLLVSQPLLGIGSKGEKYDLSLPLLP